MHVPFQASSHDSGFHAPPQAGAALTVGVLRRLVGALLIVPAALLLLLWEAIDPVNPLYSSAERDDGY
jgi:hypothetical protein